MSKIDKMIEYGQKYLRVGLEGRKELVDYYNQNCVKLVPENRRYFMSLNDNWCAMFMSVIAHKAGYSKRNFPYEVSVYFMAKMMQERGKYVEGFAGVKRGDMIVYDWNTGNRFNHIGIVVSKAGNQLNVLEGNYRGSVGVRTFTPYRGKVRGYIRLNSTSSASDIDDLANAVIRGEYGNGDERKVRLGNLYEKIQKRVNELLK